MAGTGKLVRTTERLFSRRETDQYAARVARHLPHLGLDPPVVLAGFLLHGEHRRHRHAVPHFDPAAADARTG